MPSMSSIPTITSTLSPIKSSTIIASGAVGINLSINGNEMQCLPASNMSASPVASNNKCPSPVPMTSSIGSPIFVHHTPVRSRDIGEDMEQIRLSRQDNPYLQRVAGSQTTLVDEECIDSALSDNEDTTQLVSQSVAEDALSLSEVHEHLIRSPPPTVVPKTMGHFLFDTSFIDRYKTLPPLKVNFNPVMLTDHDDMFDNQFRPATEHQRQLAVPKDCNTTSASAPNSPAKMLSRSDQYIRKPLTRPVIEEVHASLLLGNSLVSEDRTCKNKIPLAPVQPPKINSRVPEQVFLNNPLLNHVSSVNCPARHVMSSDHTNLNRSSSVKVTSSLSVNGTNLTLPIKCPHQPANTQVA